MPAPVHVIVYKPFGPPGNILLVLSACHTWCWSSPLSAGSMLHDQHAADSMPQHAANLRVKDKLTGFVCAAAASAVVG
jgi:hypothetical protein